MSLENRLQDPSPHPGKTVESVSSPQEAVGLLRIDPAASAALADAVRSAEGLRPAAAPLRHPDHRGSKAPRGAVDLQGSKWHGVIHATWALGLIGAGWLASYAGTLANQEAIHRIGVETARSQEILTRLGEDLESLKETLAAFKDPTQTASIVSASDQARLAEKVERLAVAVQDPGRKLAALETKLDRMEGQITASLAGLNAKPPASGTPAEPLADAAIRPIRSEPVEGWLLREVYDGAALVEGQNRRLYEVVPGGFIPGIGRVETIERRGGRWVVVTDKGIIGAAR